MAEHRGPKKPKSKPAPTKAPRTEFFLYGKIPVLFAYARDEIVVKAFQPEERLFKRDRSYWHLIEFDKSNLARKITASEFLKQIESYGGTKAMFDATLLN